MCKTETKWLFCFGFPVEERSFSKDVGDPAKDFVRHFIRYQKKQNQPFDWNTYKRVLIRPYRTFKKAFRRRGVEFVDECTSATLREKMALQQYEAIILFSHCIGNGTADEAVECFDGLIPSETIVAMIPDTISRIYDFSVCRPDWLVSQANLRKPKNVYASSSAYIPLPVWLVIYFETFRNASLHKMDYLHAFDKAILDAKTLDKK